MTAVEPRTIIPVFLWIGCALALFLSADSPQPAGLAQGLLLLGVLSLYLGMALPRWGRLSASLPGRPWSLPLVLSALGLLGLELTGSFDLFAAFTLSLYLLIPAGLARWDRSGNPHCRLSPTLLVAILCLWLPVEWGMLPPLSLPRAGGLGLLPLLAVLTALHAFQTERELPRIGFHFQLSLQECRGALSAFALFLAFCALPIGLPTGFLQTSAQFPSPAWLAIMFLVTFLWTALPEELLFRGILQNLLTRTWGRPWCGLGVVSLLFGLAHSNNPRPPLLELDLPGGGSLSFPWVYVLLASLAGLFYGVTYQRTGKITLSALVHALVNTWWAAFFHG